MSGQKTNYQIVKTVLNIDLRQKEHILFDGITADGYRKFSNDYCNALNLVLELFPEVDREN